MEDDLTVKSSEISNNERTMKALKTPAVEYLNGVLGKILPLALSEICAKRPPDPIEELARWLYQWADCELYFYEKAIFAKELQLIALQLEKERSRRLARMYALNREAFALKYLLANQKALLAFLSKQTLSKLTLDVRGSLFQKELDGWVKEFAESKNLYGGRAGSRDFAGGRHMAGEKDFAGQRESAGTRSSDEARELRDLVGEDYGQRSVSVSSEGRLSTSTGRRRATTSDLDERRKRKGLTGFDELDSTSRILGKRRGRRTTSELDSAGGYGQSRWARKARMIGESEDERYDAWADTYGPDAKLKYGFAFTPVRCTWYLADPNILVCVHPVLGEIRATIPTRTPLANTPEWWEQNEHNIEVMYDHEIYTHPAPHFDDDIYKDVMIVWEDEYIEPDIDNILLDENTDEDI